MKQLNFDPYCSLRTLLETLYLEGLTGEALQISRRIDEAQLEAWQEPIQKKA